MWVFTPVKSHIPDISGYLSTGTGQTKWDCARGDRPLTFAALALVAVALPWQLPRWPGIRIYKSLFAALIFQVLAGQDPHWSGGGDLDFFKQSAAVSVSLQCPVTPAADF